VRGRGTVCLPPPVAATVLLHLSPRLSCCLPDGWLPWPLPLGRPVAGSVCHAPLSAFLVRLPLGLACSLGHPTKVMPSASHSSLSSRVFACIRAGKYLARQTCLLRGVVPMMAAPMSEESGGHPCLLACVCCQSACLQRYVRH
jgi:hypothetical protein